jgi:two-component system cell cycle response regulator
MKSRGDEDQTPPLAGVVRIASHQGSPTQHESVMKTPEKERALEKNVLIVDDEALFRGTLRDLVESFGYLCTEANSAQTALELMKRTHFPIVISDIVMPEMDGLELLGLIKEQYPDVDVLMITGYEHDHSPMKIVQAGATDFLPKPFTVEQLGAKLYKIEKEKALKSKLFHSSITDELTRLYNRRHFYEKLNEEIQRANRQGRPLSLIMFDLDGFKNFNDRYGHLKGDALLQTVARVLRESLREHVDCGFRYGGDEFVVILPEADGKTALLIGNLIKKSFKDTAPGGLTLSMGVAEFQKDFDTETFVHLVDERMYKEKQKTKELGQSQLEVDLGKDNYYIHCVNCGNLVHWASWVCESCLADPRKKVAIEKSRERSGPLLREIIRTEKERRRSPRVRLKKTFLHDGFQATIQNMSQEGIQIKTRMPIAVGDMLTIALVLENNIVRFNGTVVYLRPLSDGHSLAGLRFFDISDENSRILSRFLETHSLKSPLQNHTEMD